MLKNAQHILMFVNAINEGWQWYNLAACFPGVEEKTNIKTMDYYYRNLCTPNSEYTIDIHKRKNLRAGFSILKNNELVLMVDGNKDLTSGSRIYPEYSVIKPGKKSSIYMSNPDKMNEYLISDYTLENHLPEDEHFQLTMLSDIVQHSDIAKLKKLRDDCSDFLSKNLISYVVNNSAEFNEIDLSGTEINPKFLSVVECEYKHFIERYHKAKTSNITFYDFYKGE